MTEQELREPPLLSAEGMQKYFEKQIPERERSELFDLLICDYMAELLMAAQAQRKADIKWMKKHCHLKAERELLKVPKHKAGYFEKLAYKLAQQDMLKEDKNGISFKAVKEFKD